LTFNELFYLALAAINGLLAMAALKVFSPRPLNAAPPRRSSLSLMIIAAIFLLYMGATILGQVVLLTAQAARHATSQPETATAPATLAAEPSTAPSFEPADAPEQMAEMGAIALFAGLGLVIASIWLARSHVTGGLGGWGLAPRLIVKGVAWGTMGFLLIYPLLNLVSLGVGAVLDYFHKEMALHPALQALQSPMSLAVKLAIIASAAVVAPVVEEIFFRGLLQTALLQRGWGVIPAPQYSFTPPSPLHRWGAITIASAVFAASHLMPSQFLTLFVLALALGYVYERTGNLWASITLHAIFNAVNLALFLSAGRE
jgi:membrane protease YdiL (CAAX protease family)